MSEYHGKHLKTTVSTLKRSENLCWRSLLPNGLRPMFCRLILVFFTVFVLVRNRLTWNQKEKRNIYFRKITLLEFFKKNPLKVILKFSISRLFSINNEKKTFLVVFMVFACLLLASNVQR